MQNQEPASITRWTAVFLLPFLLAAGLILYLWPDRTEELFAWTITPRMTPLLMGAGYLSGFYFFLRAATAKSWYSVRLGFLPITAFAWLAALATVLHWDRFNHDHVTFFAWAGLYALTPLILPVVYRSSRGNTPQAPGDGRPLIPTGFAAAILIAGLWFLAAGAALYIIPDRMIPTWPWQLSPLTARIVGSFLVLAGLTDILLALDRRWQAVRIVMESQLIGLVLLLLGVLRALGTLEWTNPSATVFVAGLGLLFILLAATYLQFRIVPARSIPRV